MKEAIQKVLLTEERIKTRIAELGQELAADYAGKTPVFVGLLKGVMIFYADMVRATQISCQMDFMCVSSYSGTDTTGVIKLRKDVDTDLRGRHVVILEDIVDSGLTLNYILEHLKSKEPASVRICALLDKPSRRKLPVELDYVGFTIPNEFVVGYGLDYNEVYRNLPFIGVLKPEIYSE